MKNAILGLLASVALCGADAQEAAPPMMGWASWNTYRVNISDKLIMHQADLMKELGLDKFGYKFVNIDDGWFGGRDEATGRLKTHPERFPQGLKPVADHIHALGLKAGIYSDGGENTCGSYFDNDPWGIGVGLLGHDEEDCEYLFGECGFDFIKVDFCGGVPRKNFGRVALDEKARYTAIRRAMDKVRPGLRLNVCRGEYPGAWVADVAESWRISHDVRPKWSNIKDIIEQNLYLSAYASPGHYNDMDMLEVGRGMTDDEDFTHFAVWAFMSSPLMIGCDLQRLKDKPSLRELLTCEGLIALNQDTADPQGRVVKKDGDAYVLVRDIKERFGTERAILFLNLGDETKDIRIDAADVDLDSFSLTGLTGFAGLTGWSGNLANPVDPVKKEMSVSVPPHGARVVTVAGTKRLERERYEAEWAFIPDYQELHEPLKAKTGFYKPGGSGVSPLVASNCRELVWRDVWSKAGGEYELSYGDHRERLTLKPGANEIRLRAADGKTLPDIDYITLRRVYKVGAALAAQGLRRGGRIWGGDILVAGGIGGRNAAAPYSRFTSGGTPLPPVGAPLALGAAEASPPLAVALWGIKRRDAASPCWRCEAARWWREG